MNLFNWLTHKKELELLTRMVSNMHQDLTALRQEHVNPQTNAPLTYDLMGMIGKRNAEDHELITKVSDFIELVKPKPITQLGQDLERKLNGIQ